MPRKTAKKITSSLNFIIRPHGHDIELDSLKTSVVFKFMIILQNLITTNHRESGKNKYDRKLPQVDA